MLAYIVRRVLGAIPTMFILITLAFFLIRIAPGGPFDLEKKLPPQIQANLDRIYHLDESLLFQFCRYFWNIIHCDFGPSFQYQDYGVNELIRSGFPVSLSLGLTAMIIAVFIGCLLGGFSALKQNTFIDHVFMSVAMLGIAIPNFVLAPLLILFFAVNLDWFPAGSWNNGHFSHRVLPIICLAVPQLAYIARLMRGSMIEVLGSPYILTARAKGLSDTIIILRHALPPAILPVLSYFGPAVAAIITGSVVIEQIFGLPGVGRYFVQGALNRDYTLVMGIVIFYGTLIIGFNLIVDVLYGVIDPKVRYR